MAAFPPRPAGIAATRTAATAVAAVVASAGQTTAAEAGQGPVARPRAATPRRAHDRAALSGAAGRRAWSQAAAPVERAADRRRVPRGTSTARSRTDPGRAGRRP